MKREKAMDKAKGIKETHLQGGQQRITAIEIRIPERQRAGFNHLHHKMPQGIKIE